MDTNEITPEERAKRAWDVAQAFHSTRLEGYEPSKESIELAAQWTRGDITIEEWLQQIKEKHK